VRSQGDLFWLVARFDPQLDLKQVSNEPLHEILTVFDEDRMAIQTVIAFGPPTEIIDILCESHMAAGSGQISSKSFFNLTLEFFQSHVIDGVL
jgi:hypothetical protein